MTKPPAPSAPRPAKPKMGFTFSVELDQDARAVFRAASHADTPNYGDFLLQAVLDHVEAQEVAHNGGRAWPPVTAAQMRRTATGRGRPKGDTVKTTVTTYPTPEQGDRIRGTAVGLEMPLTDLITDGITARIKNAPRAEPGPLARGRSIGPGRKAAT